MGGLSIGLIPEHDHGQQNGIQVAEYAQHARDGIRHFDADARELSRIRRVVGLPVCIRRSAAEDEKQHKRDAVQGRKYDGGDGRLYPAFDVNVLSDSAVGEQHRNLCAGRANEENHFRNPCAHHVILEQRGVGTCIFPFVLRTAYELLCRSSRRSLSSI